MESTDSPGASRWARSRSRMPTWLQPPRPVRGAAAVAPSVPVTPLQAADVLSRAVPDSLGSGEREAPSGPVAGTSSVGSRSAIALGERPTPEERVAESEPMASGMPASLAGHSISHAAFIATVQDVGALATAEEADRAAVAVLGELVGCLSWTAAQNLMGCLPRPLRRRVSLRSFDSSMCRFAPQAFLRQVARQERVGISRAAQDTRAVLRALDLILPKIFRQQLHAELASLWGPLTRQAQ